MKKKRILFIVHHRKHRSPGQRFRFEQYINYLEKNGFECVFSPLLSEEQDKSFYAKGTYWGKLKVLLSALYLRFKDVRRADDFDIVFLFREAFMTGSYFFERQFKKSKAKLVFDFDDSIWVDNISEGNKIFSFLKDASKTSSIIELCDIVFAGNQYLADYASKYNNNVNVVPTTIDTEEYRRIPSNHTNKITIGWSGSVTTIQHFSHALPFLKAIKEKYKDQVNIKVIGDSNYRNEELEIIGLPWKKEDELKELSTFDIGIMPLPDDEWAKGKCGLKGLQYMALEIPTIMSPVGVNADIIQHGENGFLATTQEEWLQCIETLIADKNNRERIGKNGRDTVVKKYSVDSQKDNYIKLLNSILS